MSNDDDVKRDPHGTLDHPKPSPIGDAPVTRSGLHGSPYILPQAILISRSSGESFVAPLYPERAYTFGRSTDCTVSFEEDFVSRKHGQLEFSNGRWLYRDLGSTNGTHRSEFLTAAEEDDPVVRLSAGDVPICAGQSLVLGKRGVRIGFLPTYPVNRSARADNSSEPSRRLEEEIEINAQHDEPVFLLGPSGSGKTHVAHEIHLRSGREGPFVEINCGALPTDPVQLRCDLLGYVKGAYTGANESKQGQLQYADKGTLFLDEVESMPKVAQDFLLNVLERKGSFLPHGAPPGTPARIPSFRLLSASKVSLGDSELRFDLTQRLGAGALVILPTLDERRADIPLFVAEFVGQLERENQIKAEFTPDAVALLAKASYPGQLRELKAIVTTLARREHVRQRLRPPPDKDATAVYVLVDGKPVPVHQTMPSDAGGPRVRIGAAEVSRHLEDRLRAFKSSGTHPAVKPAVAVTTFERPAPGATTEMVPRPLSSAASPPAPLKKSRQLDKEDIVRALHQCNHVLQHAADALGISVNTLKTKMARFGLR